MFRCRCAVVWTKLNVVTISEYVRSLTVLNEVCITHERRNNFSNCIFCEIFFLSISQSFVLWQAILSLGCGIASRLSLGRFRRIVVVVLRCV